MPSPYFVDGEWCGSSLAEGDCSADRNLVGVSSFRRSDADAGKINAPKDFSATGQNALLCSAKTSWF